MNTELLAADEGKKLSEIYLIKICEFIKLMCMCVLCNNKSSLKSFGHQKKHFI